MDEDQAAKDGGDSTSIETIRERYEFATEAERENRNKAIEDYKFLNVPGEQWDYYQRQNRRGRPTYEFPILRSHWRQVVNDQKKQRPQIKVRAVEDADVKAAEMRQGIIHNIESVSNAERAYDSAFELVVGAGMGAWRISTRYSADDAWDQDICIEPINDPLTCVWHDPMAESSDLRDAAYFFVEQQILRSKFKKRWPKAECVEFDAAKPMPYADWFGEKTCRVCEYWEVTKVKKKLLQLSDGRSVIEDELEDSDKQAIQKGQLQITNSRDCTRDRVTCSIVSGKEILEGPVESVFDRIPIIVVYANRHQLEGRWYWCGMTRFSKDPQRLVNYNLTTVQEVLAKLPKAAPLVTPKMLEGSGVKAMWDAMGKGSVPYLPFTPDPAMPGGMPGYLTPPPVTADLLNGAKVAIDMLKASDGIFDASVGARSNETSGKAILARQQEGDTATYDYQDALSKGIQATGEIILGALPKVYDTRRVLRILGKDGAEDFVTINDGLNDLSAGKYDVTIDVGASYDTQRMEFVEALTQLGQGNPAIAQGVPDLIVGAMDFPKAEEAAERLKLLLPPPIQQAMAQKDQSPAVLQLQNQMQQMKQQAQQQIQALHEQLQQAMQKANSAEGSMLKAQNEQARLQIDAKRLQDQSEIAWFDAETRRLQVLQATAHADADVEVEAWRQTQQAIQTEGDESFATQ